MADANFLESAFVYLTATVVSVPIAKRIGLGSVLGYLIAGTVIGPYVLNLVGDPESIMHTAEFGVVIMLFLIGLELQPSLLWRLRTAILGMGGLQVVATAAVITGLGMAFGLIWQVALAIGLTLSLSSTAIVLQSLREKGIAGTQAGRATFSVLLFQDIAIIPMLALFPLLATLALDGDQAGAKGALAAYPGWVQGLAVVVAVGAIVVAGRLLLRPMFRWVAASGMHEILTAFALLLVVGVALLMQLVGISPALGAFVAGVVLADSEFRHQIESDIDPFRGLLLGLFFISVGAGINFALLFAQPLLILGLVLALIVVKALVMFAVARAFRHKSGEAALIGLGLAQGGEFAFVLFAFAQGAGVISAAVSAPLVLVVALSMAVTPLLLMAGDWALARWEAGSKDTRAPEIEEGHPDVIVAGYGRFGQIVGRMLGSYGHKISVLDHDAEQVDVLRGFGRKVNFGDATRLDLLRLAGAQDAKLLIIAIDQDEKALELVETAREAFPNLKILARAIDRRHAYQLMAKKVDGLERETFASAVRLGVKSLILLGKPAFAAERAGQIFTRYDERALTSMFEDWQRVEFADYQRIVRDRTALEEELLKRDMVALLGKSGGDEWGEETLEREAFERALAAKAKSD
jgi:glutathione-regulated potassium-efflux system ancillary protein KefC/glutathione-regulated potassium-efflux system protein KefB